MKDLLEKAEMNPIWTQSWILPSKTCLCLSEIHISLWEQTPSSWHLFLCSLRRPETSFFWFTNPCKTCKFIVWRKFKWLFLGFIVLILVLLFIGILLYSLPVSNTQQRNIQLIYQIYKVITVYVCVSSYRTTFRWKLSNPFNEIEVLLHWITTSWTHTHT